MKKWPIIVAGLYGLTFVILFGALAWIAFLPNPIEPSEFMTWQFGVITGVMILSQLALLQIPVKVASRRPVTQRSLWTTVIAAALMMALLVFGATVSIMEFLTRGDTADTSIWVILGIAAASWIFWALYFRHCARSAPHENAVKNMQRFLWSGSILELLIAIPTHIIARHRNYCCAGIMTFIGLTCGFSVMAFAFGPAIYFLFAERWRRLHPTQQE